MTYIIQTKKIVNTRGVNLNSKNSSSQLDWINQSETYDNIEEAQQKCKQLIEESNYKASHIRILSVVCTFENNIIINGAE